MNSHETISIFFPLFLFFSSILIKRYLAISANNYEQSSSLYYFQDTLFSHFQ